MHSLAFAGEWFILKVSFDPESQDKGHPEGLAPRITREERVDNSNEKYITLS